MTPKRIPFPEEGNPLYPLPADYETLTPEGQRLARVNGCSQWRLRYKSKRVTGRAYIASLDLFDSYYLHPNLEAEFDPMFYDQEPLPTPVIHDAVSRQWANNRLCIAIAPRGSAKSVKMRKSILMEMVSCPMWSVFYATSTLENTKMTGQVIKDQLRFNDRLNGDWGPEFPAGRIKPKRGEAPFGATHMQLMNGSWLRCTSAESKLRGGRPRIFALDDPEYDPRASTSMQLIRDYMHTLLFSIVLPMIMRAGSGCRWLATFVSRRHYAWHAMEVDAAGRAKDPRFNLWDRLKIVSEWVDEEGELQSCWPEMWPPTTKKRLELAREDPYYEKVVSLEEIKQMIGLPAYLREYMARPGEGDEVFFPILEEERHGYWFEELDNQEGSEPWKSEAMVCYWEGEDKERKKVKKPLSTLVRESRLFMTVDTSYTATKDSDSKVCTLMAVTSEGSLWVLDLWSAQCHPPRLIEAALQMASRWRCPAVYVEGVKEGITIYHDLRSAVATRIGHGDAFVPSVQKFSPGMTEKAAKIATLRRRFDYGKIKLPLRRRHEHPWRNLFNQIEEFNPDAPDGGLQHDDELDTISMSMYVVKGRVAPTIRETRDQRTPLERLGDGEMTDAAGLPIVLGMDVRTIPADTLALFARPLEARKSGPTKV